MRFDGIWGVRAIPIVSDQEKSASFSPVLEVSVKRMVKNYIVGQAKGQASNGE